MAELLPLTVEPLPLEKIRWFYRTCEPGSSLEPFCGSDSLALEEAYRNLVSGGKKDGVFTVSVLGDMHEVKVKLNESSITPIYWEVSKPWTVTRGTWFEMSKEKYTPLNKVESDLLEENHCQRVWQESQLSQTLKLHLNQVCGLHEAKIVDYQAVWLGHSEICKVKLDLANKLVRGVRTKIFKDEFATCSRLVRGYQEPSSREDRPPPIGHVVFAIHGIGQNQEKDFVETVYRLRENCANVAKKDFHDCWKEKRLEIIPVEWRKSLQLGASVIESCHYKTSDNSWRSFFEKTFLDILYYMSQIFSEEIKDGFCKQLNKQYDEFIRRHPNFISNGGTVSLFGHSLGSVMCYDLMYKTAQSRGLLQAEAESLKSCSKSTKKTAQSRVQQQIDVSKSTASTKHVGRNKKLFPEDNSLERTLKFNVDHLFLVGSPLGVFITMTKKLSDLVKEHKEASTLLPISLCQRIYNLNFPSDPVAYRLEPLINPSKFPIDAVEVNSTVCSNARDRMFSHLARENKAQSSSKEIGKISSLPVSVDQCLNSENRLDFELTGKLQNVSKILQNRITEPYFALSMAHFDYWTNADVAMFLLLQIYSYQRRSEQK